jgi:aryl-alcohol dehydrogenase-like predicted oxidoreductase
MDRPERLERDMSRRGWLKLALGTGIAAMGAGGTPAAPAPAMIVRAIPASGERLPVIGLGTWQTFDVGAGESERAPLREVLRAFVYRGGRLIDSSPMYGAAEGVVGELAAELGVRERLFLATKVWTRGRDAGVRQMKRSFQRLRTGRMDLMQVHNLLDWRTHLGTLRAWKDEGRIRYLGVTHYTAGAYADLERVLASEPLDFVQLNYSLAEREAEQRLLPLAADRGVGVIVNRPFAEGALFARVRGKAPPPWAGEIGCATWAQFFLKFIVSHPAVTCAIPATGKVRHLEDNMQAAFGALPDAAMRRRMAGYFAAL